MPRSAQVKAFQKQITIIKFSFSVPPLVCNVRFFPLSGSSNHLGLSPEIFMSSARVSSSSSAYLLLPRAKGSGEVGFVKTFSFFHLYQHKIPASDLFAMLFSDGQQFACYTVENADDDDFDVDDGGLHFFRVPKWPNPQMSPPGFVTSATVLKGSVYQTSAFNYFVAIKKRTNIRENIIAHKQRKK